jgi:hypothetical protein
MNRPGVAIAGVAAIALAACGAFGDSPDESAGPSWDAARTSADGRSVLLVFTGGAPADPNDPCSKDYRVDVDEDDDQVSLGIVTISNEVEPRGDVDVDEAIDVGCEALGFPRTVAVELDAPLGTRTVFDSFLDTARPVFDGSRFAEPTLPEGWVLRGEGIAHPAIDPSQAWLRSWGPPVLGSECSQGFSVVQGTPEAVGALPPEMGGQVPIETVDIGGVAAAYTETPERQTQRLQWTADGTGFAVLVTTCGEPVDVVRLFEFARSID